MGRGVGSVLASIPMQFYFWPHASHEHGELARALLGLCLAFALGGPVVVASYFAADKMEASP